MPLSRRFPNLTWEINQAGMSRFQHLSTMLMIFSCWINRIEMFVTSAAVGNSGRASTNTPTALSPSHGCLDKTGMLTVCLEYANLKLIIIISTKGRYRTSPPSHRECVYFLCVHERVICCVHKVKFMFWSRWVASAWLSD